MPKLDVTEEISFKEVISSIELADITGDGKDNLILSTINGDIRIYEFQQDKKEPAVEICTASNLPPVATLGVGDVTGNGVPDIIAGGMDNSLKTVSYEDGKLVLKDTTPLGDLPTAICVLNVEGDDAMEVIVATSDNALRCYSWFEVALDKLAHKVVEHPIFSMVPLHTKGVPYSRFVFGDESGHLYVYQYQDDRLHERSRIKVKGQVNLVATGSITNSRTDEIIAVSDGSVLNFLHVVQNEIKMIDRIRAPGAVTSVRIGSIGRQDNDEYIMSSQGNSKLTLLSFYNNRMNEYLSIKTAKKAIESLIDVGNLYGNDENHIIQAVANKINVISIVDD